MADSNAKGEKMRKIFSILAAAVLLLTGCSQVQKSGSESPAVIPEAPQEDTVLTIAAMGELPEEAARTINAMNEADNGITIVTRDYSGFYEGDAADGYTDDGMRAADFTLIQDIINTDDIDIVTSQSFFDIAKYEILQNKGAFADLYQFMESDPEVNTDTLNSHVLSLAEKGGKLYTLPAFYGISTLIGRAEYVGSKENWTVDEFISRWEEMPENSTINYDRTREEAFYTILRGNISSFIDYKNAQVHFDSPEFKRILEFCSRFEFNNGNKSAYDFDAPNFVGYSIIMGFMCEKGYFSSGENTLVGFPTYDGKGSFLTPANTCWSVSAKSSPEKQQAAWELIRTFCTEEWLNENVMVYKDYGTPENSFWNELPGFSLNDKFCRQLGYDISDGKYYDGLIHGKEGDYYVELPSHEDIEKLLDYINSTEKWEVKEDSALSLIVREEVFRYFADEITLDECIELIQNRAAIWVSEQQ